MDPFVTAFAPSLSSSLAGGATGALEGQMAGEDRVLKNQLTQAQIDWQRAHAAGYGHQQKTSQAAMDQLMAGLKADPNFLRTEGGRALSYIAGKFDIMNQDASADRYTGYANAANAQAGLRGELAQTEGEIRQPKIEAMTGLRDVRRAGADQLEQMTPGKVANLGYTGKLLQQKALSEGSLQGLRGWQAKLAEERAALARQQAANAGKGGGHALNLYSMTEMVMQRVQDALAEVENGGPGPDPNDIVLLDDLRTKMRGPEYSALPLGSPGVFNKDTGIIPQPEVPATSGIFGYGAKPGTPATPPAKPPLNLAPKPRASARPGAAETEQSLLKAQKLIKERGSKFASEQLKSNKALTPTERLALQQALEKAMTGASLNE
jgi:hypothetical protein